jgi:hypothetical protein
MKVNEASGVNKKAPWINGPTGFNMAGKNHKNRIYIL